MEEVYESSDCEFTCQRWQIYMYTFNILDMKYNKYSVLYNGQINSLSFFPKDAKHCHGTAIMESHSHEDGNLRIEYGGFHLLDNWAQWCA